MKHLPRSLASQIKATCQKCASRSNMLSTSYKDTHRVHKKCTMWISTTITFTVDQSWSIPAKREQNWVTQMLRNKKCSLFRKGKEKQKMHISENKKWKGEQGKLIFREKKDASREELHTWTWKQVPIMHRGKIQEKVHLCTSDELSCRWIRHAVWDEGWLKLKPLAFLIQL